MAKIYTSNEFIKILKHITNLPTIYYSGGSQWSSWNGSSWNFDCVCSVKSVLWQWAENKNAIHGGAKYASNGVPDFTCNGALNYCTNVSTNFSNLTPGEYLCMKDTQYNHTGIYLGNGKVFEVTTAWGVNGATISDIDKWGNRSRNGIRSLKWTYHGKLKWIDYSITPTPVDNVDVFYKVKTIKHGWLPEVKNLEDYAGWENSPIVALAVKVSAGSIWYQAHIKGGGWLPKVTGYNINDFNNGYAGDGREIDCIRIYYNTPGSIIKNSGYKKAKYKVNNYSWQYDNEVNQYGDNFAGSYGKNAVKVQIIIE